MKRKTKKPKEKAMPATKTQATYINDLVVKKTKEFKEVKELVASLGIGGETVANAKSVAEITDAIAPSQATKIIDALTAKAEPKRGQFSDRRVERMTKELGEITDIIADWSFDGLQ